MRVMQAHCSTIAPFSNWWTTPELASRVRNGIRFVQSLSVPFPAAFKFAVALSSVASALPLSGAPLRREGIAR